MRQLGILITLGLFALLAATPISVTAQDATPASGRDVPDSSECTVEPGTADQVMAVFREVAATPVSTTSSAASPSPFVLPIGQPADAATTASIETATREIIACTNLYGFLGLTAVASGRHIRDILTFDVASGISEADAMAFLAATPEPLTSDESVAFVEVRDVIVLEDARIGAVIVGDEPGAGQVTLYFIFVQENGRYLLDEEFDLPADGTPTP